ncbi:hypothetical protein MIND_00124300 [Mycena indigotica]|uniref:Transmembrane protein n=1 Tax=Mycena indigotica TaxID=2126181 RepID=A0A8H6TCJ0_9AGAR|nr:uncharacterized protein MIND_00124300 [Mycena indigotica]KAF7316063.1 hypothetical protein MIND_00124300 [Mycena indigotica]
MNIIVDDRDPAISYQPAWRTTTTKGGPLGQAREYAGTTSHAGSQGAAASFTFTGTQISVYGTISATQTNLSLTIDGHATSRLIPTPEGQQLFHQPVFVSDALPDGEHTLTITNTASTGDGFFLDYLIYKTGKRNAGQTIFVDETDASITFSGAWSQNNTYNFFQQTSHYTGTAGDTATISYNFSDGDKLSLFGTLPLALSAAVSIDGAAPVPVLPSSGVAALNQRLYGSPAMSAGPHTFKFVHNTGPQLTIDYFLIETGSTGSSQGSTSNSASSLTPILSTIVSVSTDNLGAPHTTTIIETAPNMNSATPSSSAIMANSSKSHTGLIAGAVIGAICVLLFCVGMFICLWRRHRLEPNTSMVKAEHIAHATAPNPFPVPPLESEAVPENTAILAASWEPSVTEKGPHWQKPIADHVQDETPSGLQQQTMPVVAASDLPTQELVRILNSRLQSNQVPFDVDEVPPSYLQGEAGY